MKTLVLLVANLACCLTLPSLDWSKIQPKYAFVGPSNQVSQPIHSRIAGGRESQPHSRPYQAAVFVDGTQLCSGSLISKNFVLTSAFCLAGATYVHVILGAHNISRTESTQLRIRTTNFRIHPDYNQFNLINDVGLIELPEAINFTQEIQPISLAFDGSFVGFQATLSGWGKVQDDYTTVSSTLQEVDLIVIDNLKCRDSYGDATVRDSVMCTSGDGGIGTCDGDSGSPLVVSNIQIGISSFRAVSGCETGFPSGYARVTSFLDWIVEHTNL